VASPLRDVACDFLGRAVYRAFPAEIRAFSVVNPPKPLSDTFHATGSFSGEFSRVDGNFGARALALDDTTVPVTRPQAVARKVGRLPEITMKAMKNLLAKLVKDEQGGEVLEYALIAGLIVVAAIAIISAVGTKVLGRWTSLNNSL
jgi:Flp pilus assembly pilin Flp